MLKRSNLYSIVCIIICIYLFISDLPIGIYLSINEQSMYLFIYPTNYLSSYQKILYIFRSETPCQHSQDCLALPLVDTSDAESRDLDSVSRNLDADSRNLDADSRDLDADSNSNIIRVVPG